MTMQSQYALDDRIKSIDDVQTCLHYDDKYIGEDGYFATDLCDLSNLSRCLHSTLAQIISDAGDDIFRTAHDVDCDNWGCRFFIPDSLLKPIQKKCRPYTKNEFLNMFECGKPINIRHKDDHINVFIETMSSVRIDNFMDEVYVRLYERVFDLKELFDEFEWQKSNGDWHPFGVEE